VRGGMSLSGELKAIADHAVLQTFERASIAWQSIPHWDTDDRGQAFVRSDRSVAIAGLGLGSLGAPAGPFGGTPLNMVHCNVQFRITLAQATARTPDALLSAMLPRVVDLARRFDQEVLPALAQPAITEGAPPWYRQWAQVNPALAAVSRAFPGRPIPQEILPELITARQLLEDSGYRAPCCLIASTQHFTDLHQWVGSNVVTEGLLRAANANTLYRATQLDANVAAGRPNDLTLILGRSREVPRGRAGEASPGEEPVDVAISVPPSLEVIGETVGGRVELAVRVRFATRVKDERGVIAFWE
jgi:hypothetical protein